MRRALSVLLLATAATGCDPRISEEGRIPLDQLGRSGTPAGETTLAGTVLEQIPAGQYVYVRLRTATGEAWAAVTATPVTVGEQVTILEPMLMRSFESTTLERTFDAVYFGTLSRSSAVSPDMNPHAGGMQPAAAVNVGSVEKASGSNARTVAEAWQQKESLSGRTVAVRGVVVKVTPGVMGKNWVHLQDGSGDAASGTNDLTVATSELVSTGETVTITGTVRINRDIGAGYVFPLMVEEATVARK
jgi:hypothetical protein